MSSTHPETRAQAAAHAAPLSGVLPGIATPKALFLLAAGVSFLISVSLFFSGDHERGIFVGIWVPSILSAGTLLMGRE